MQKHDNEQLKELQNMPLWRKVGVTIARITEWYNRYNGNVYVSFSGGKDSTVLLDIVRKRYPDIPAVFCDTGLEYPEIRKYVKEFKNVKFLKPTRTFYDVVYKYGYPVLSKIISDTVHMARSKPGGYYAQKFDPNSEVSKKYGGRYCVARHAHLLKAPFKCTALCCKIFKKDPIKKYERETKRTPFIGMLAAESMERRRQWIKNGCNAFDKTRPSSNPMAFWRKDDVLEYAFKENINLASVYGKIINENGEYKTDGLESTGCIFCMFGLQRDKSPNRFERLKITHPKLYNYCMGGADMM